ncbi:unnamed protein product [Cyprideis torosa]|uniref:Phosphatidylinositol transfer protein N-terminal domain-containing protein n=1 Tax=Cyprideis torosa TaxID=163714 RepID=A0A7R8ZM26_9CRUS|nr:unnamed protein product [Cyprideis torosa]CAG0887981.1 unnamed protein product [Cyprideis torosa]
MLIKEYRIPLPLTISEYRIAQLYMIALYLLFNRYNSQKKSRDESNGAGSGIEILVNTPYTDGPGGSGQYTHKIYHVGSHLPGWLKALIPKSALTVEEEAWNAYPYTKTRYKCPFVDKFSLEIETYYFDDPGDQVNVFGLKGSDLREREVGPDQLFRLPDRIGLGAKHDPAGSDRISRIGAESSEEKKAKLLLVRAEKLLFLHHKPKFDFWQNNLEVNIRFERIFAANNVPEWANIH